MVAMSCHFLPPLQIVRMIKAIKYPVTKSVIGHSDTYVFQLYGIQDYGLHKPGLFLGETEHHVHCPAVSLGVFLAAMKHRGDEDVL